MTIDQALQLGYQHHEAGRWAEAEKIYRQVLAQQPNNTDALHLLGMLAGQRGDFMAAAELTRRAIQVEPNRAVSHYNLGLALKFAGQIEGAIAACREAIRLKPDYAEAYNILGSLFLETGRAGEASGFLRLAVGMKPDFPDAHNNLGLALKDTGDVDEAIASFRQAVRCKPDYAEAHNNLGILLLGKNQIDDAMACCRRAIQFKPDLAEAHNNLANALKELGQVDAAIGGYNEALRIKPDDAVAHGNILFASHYLAVSDAKGLFDQSREWNRRHAEPLKRFIQPHSNDRDPLRRLRIGYISSDFCEHPCAFFLLPLFRRHDRRQFEVTCYSNRANADRTTEELRSCVQHWREIAGQSDTAVAAMVRDDKIDILVDLNLHTAGNRLLVLAQKPAPVQVTWLGYAATTGMDAIDYRLTDPYLDPPGVDDAFYSEKCVRLPHTFWCYEARAIEPTVNALPCVEAGFVTFGSLNTFCKINEGVLSLWARVLSAVANSRLIILAPEGSPRQWVRDRLAIDGINPARLEFVAKQPRLNYLLTYHGMDIALDTFPYAGGTITCDTTWMGVPTITLRGRTAVGRGGVSILSNLGLPELIAGTPDQYVQIAARLAGDLPKLAELRRTLRARMHASPLMDAPRFARDVEAAYRAMWQDWCKA